MTNLLAVNTATPMVMHIDLNSCFATIEKQANRLLRGRPVAVAAYDTPRGMVLASCYIAKASGVKLGVNVGEARQMCPGIVIMTPDPAKYREAHRRFGELLQDFTPDVVPKSIDEFVLNMTGTPALRRKILDARRELVIDPKISNLKSQIFSPVEREIHSQAMLRIGGDIKDRIHKDLGEAVTVNIGIAPNRFLAKYAAGFGKPNGLLQIDHTNLEERFTNMDLVDLPGINTRYKKRLQLMGVATPLDLFNADPQYLRKRIFKSVVGVHWHMRMRGWEADARESKRRSIGHQYALSNKTADPVELARLLMKLCEKIGRRLREDNFYATGIHLYLAFVSEDPGPNGTSLSKVQGETEKHRESYGIYDERASEVSTQQFTKNGAQTNGFAGGWGDMARYRSWHKGCKLGYRLYSTTDIYVAAKHLLSQAEIFDRVRLMAITAFGLEPWSPEQGNLFDAKDAREEILDFSKEFKPYTVNKNLSDALDGINDRYGEFAITPATMLDMKGTIVDRIAFGK